MVRTKSWRAKNSGIFFGNAGILKIAVSAGLRSRIETMLRNRRARN